MFAQLRGPLGLILVLLGVFVAMTCAPSVSARPVSRIVAIGDLHGDYAAYRAIIRAAGLVDARDRWTGGRTVFVQTGDIVDRGPDSRRIVDHLRRLERDAERAGGRVVALVGNHEAMNVTGDLRYVHPGEFAAFADSASEGRRERAYRANRSAIEAFYRERDPAITDEAARQAWLETMPLGKIEHRAAWRPDGELGRWVSRNPAVARIDSTVFVHAGISAAYAGLTIDEINRRAAAALRTSDTAPDAIINDPFGPLWYRGLVDPEAAAAGAGDELDRVLRAYGANRVVVGHTPMPEGIAVLHGGRLIAIDTGISAHYGGTRAYLEILDGEPIAHLVGEGEGQ